MERRTRPLVLTWLALLALLALSAGSAWIPLGWINTAIGLAVATVKALLVALVFMRLRAGHPLLRLTNAVRPSCRAVAPPWTAAATAPAPRCGWRSRRRTG